MGRCVRVAFIEIKGPCLDDDRELIDDMKLFWKAIIARAVALGTRIPSARLLIVGHVNRDSEAGRVIDSASYYHNPVEGEAIEQPMSRQHRLSTRPGAAR
jgi:hypothetical protein